MTKEGFLETQLALQGVNGTTDKVAAVSNTVFKDSNKCKAKLSKMNDKNSNKIQVIPKTVSMPPQDDVESVLSVASEKKSTVSNEKKLEDAMIEELLNMLNKKQGSMEGNASLLNGMPWNSMTQPFFYSMEHPPSNYYCTPMPITK